MDGLTEEFYLEDRDVNKYLKHLCSKQPVFRQCFEKWERIFNDALKCNYLKKDNNR